MRAVAIVQARMGSTRLPGKVLLPVLGRPLLGYLLERLARCRGLDAIVVATTDRPEDQAVAEYAAGLGVAVFRGSEQDVLDRYYRAAVANRADVVMRVTADCPLLDPEVCGRVLAPLLAAGPGRPDYVATSPAFAEGLDCEALTFAALERTWREAALRSEREHVTLYLKNHPERFGMLRIDNPADEGAIRITVDEPDDFFVVKAVFEALYPADAAFGFDAVRAWLRAHPGIAARNNNIIRNEGLLKSLREDGPADA